MYMINRPLLTIPDNDICTFDLSKERNYGELHIDNAV